MAYGRKRTARGFGGAFGSRSYVRTGKKKPTTRSKYRKLRKASPKKVKYTVAQNAAKIAKLDNVVNRGKYQKATERAVMVGGANYNLAPDKPMCFAANDFTCKGGNTGTDFGGPIYGAEYSGTAPNKDTTHQTVGNWYRSINQTVGNLKDMYDQWRGANDDGVSLKSYTPLKATYNLAFTIPRMTADMAERWIRVDIVKPKKILRKSEWQMYSMPSCIGAFSNMAMAPNSVERNQYNSTYWTVKSKYIKIGKVEVPKNNVSRMVKFDVTFRKKEIAIDLEQVAGAPGEDIHEPWVSNMDPRHIVWVVVSINQSATDSTNNPVMQWTRTLHWRDGAGTTT